MIRALAILLALTTTASAEPVHYCNPDLMYDVSSVDGTFVIWQQPKNAICVREDAVWFKCDGRDDYKVSFQVSEDGNELWLRTPLYKENEHETFTRCDI
jgi:hypothetical protein